MTEHRVGRNRLSREAGVAAGTVSRILLYDHIPGPDTMCALADYFHVDRDTALELAGIVQLSDLPKDLPPEVRDLTRRLYRLPPADRTAIMRQFDGILRLLEDRPRSGD